MAILQYNPVQAYISPDLVKQVQQSANPLGSALSGLGSIAIKASDYYKDKIADKWQRYQNQKQLSEDVAMQRGTDWRFANPEEYARIMNQAFSGPEGYQKSQADMAQYGLPPAVLDSFMTAAGTQLKTGDTSRKAAAEVRQSDAAAEASLASTKLHNIQAQQTAFTFDLLQRQQKASQLFNSGWAALNNDQKQEILRLWNTGNQVAATNKMQELGLIKDFETISPEEVGRRMSGIITAMPQNNAGTSFGPIAEQAEKARNAYITKLRFSSGFSAKDIYELRHNPDSYLKEFEKEDPAKKQAISESLKYEARLIEDNLRHDKVTDQDIALIQPYLTKIATGHIRDRNKYLSILSLSGNNIKNRTHFDTDNAVKQAKKLLTDIKKHRAELDFFDPNDGQFNYIVRQYANAYNTALANIVPGFGNVTPAPLHEKALEAITPLINEENTPFPIETDEQGNPVLFDEQGNISTDGKGKKRLTQGSLYTLRSVIDVLQGKRADIVPYAGTKALVNKLGQQTSSESQAKTQTLTQQANQIAQQVKETELEKNKRAMQQLQKLNLPKTSNETINPIDEKALPAKITGETFQFAYNSLQSNLQNIENKAAEAYRYKAFTNAQLQEQYRNEIQARSEAAPLFDELFSLINKAKKDYASNDKIQKELKDLTRELRKYISTYTSDRDWMYRASQKRQAQRVIDATLNNLQKLIPSK